MSRIPDKVKIYEVGPRDGLQNEKAALAVTDKVELIDRLAAAGLRFIEAGAFVSPKWVPQMVDTAAVLQQIRRRDGVVYAALVPNLRGMEDALTAGVEETAIFTAASESFNRKNINCSIKESLERFAPVMALAKENNIRVRGYVSCVAVCPYEGDIAPEAVAGVAKKLHDMGCYEISLGDTIGAATPNKIETMLAAVMHDVPVEKLALHCHDTYGQALANIYAGLRMGVSVIDSAVGGLGGCPYAKGASGNVATEDVLYMMQGLGIETGVDLQAVADTAWFICGRLGREPVSRVAHALKIA